MKLVIENCNIIKKSRAEGQSLAAYCELRNKVSLMLEEQGCGKEAAEAGIAPTISRLCIAKANSISDNVNIHNKHGFGQLSAP